MSKIFRNETGTPFLFFTNYKVMNTNLAGILKENFPGIQVIMDPAKIQNENNYTRLAVVRNPYDRLLSLYSDKCSGHPQKVKNRDDRIWLQKNQAQILTAAGILFGRHSSPVEPEKEIQKGSETYMQFLANLEVLESITFPEFVAITGWLFRQPAMDAHFWPQSRIMTKNGQWMVQHIFKLEKIGGQWDEICKLTGKTMILTEGVNRTNFEGPEKFRRFYTDELKAIVFNLYKDDFLHFNYNEK